MKGTRFEAVSSIQQTVTKELKTIREEAFSLAFDSLYERCKRCAEVMILINIFLSFLCGFYGLSSVT
jgi:hypothetical protein